LAAGSMVSHFTLVRSMPLIFAKAGKSCRWLSPGGAASSLPSRSLGFVMPVSLRVQMLSGVRSKTAPTILILAPCATRGITTTASASPTSARFVSTLAIESPDPFEFWSSTSSPFAL
jgi:hypothetical protein